MRSFGSRWMICLSGAVIVALTAVPAATAIQPEGDMQVVTPNVYLHSLDGDPWSGESGNDVALDRVLGPDNWEEENLETVDTSKAPGGLFGPGVRFIFIEGSVTGASEAVAFVDNYEEDLKQFVAGGGGLFINFSAAPYDVDQHLEYDGRRIREDNTVYSVDSSYVEGTDPTHPVFDGPFGTVTTSLSGTPFGGGIVDSHTDFTNTPLILRRQDDAGEHGPGDPDKPGDPNRWVLAEYRSGDGLVMLGGLSAGKWQEPQPDAANLRANIIHRVANAGKTAGPPPGKPPVITPPPKMGTADRTAPRVRLSHLPRRCVRRGFRVRVRASDGSSGLAALTLRLDGRRLGGRRPTGADHSSFSMRIPAKRLASGRHRLKLVAIDAAGNRRIATKSFWRCAR